MTNSIEKAERAMKRRDVFDRLAKKANESMTPVLSEAIDEIASLDAEIERLKTVPMRYRRLAFNAKLQDENDSLSKQVTLLNTLAVEAKQAFDGVKVDSRWFDRGMAILDEALAATAPKEVL